MSPEMMTGARIASLAMYRDPSEIAAATRAMWTHLGASLRADGMADAPATLNEAIAHDAAWLDPRLLLAQSCGYPLATRLRGQVRLVATPVYDHPNAGGSFIVVGADFAGSLADLRGRTAAVNDRASNTGMNLFRHAIASHARDRRFLGRVVESGGHVASIGLVAGGAADAAAIDSVTWGNLARHAPERLAGVRILAETARTPGLPLITRAGASDAEVTALRRALDRFAADPAAAPIRDTLGLAGFDVLADADYDAVLALERAAAALGYPELA